MPSLVKNLDFGGLNLKETDLSRDPRDARDCLNVYLTGRGELESVNGFVDTGYSKSSDIVGVYKWYNKLRGVEELVVNEGSTWYSYDGTTRRQLTSDKVGTLDSYTEQKDVVLAQNCMFINGMQLKYDGLMLSPSYNWSPNSSGWVRSVVTAGNLYSRTMIGHIDTAGNFVIGEYTAATELNGLTGTITSGYADGGYSCTANGLQNVNVTGSTFNVNIKNINGTLTNKWFIYWTNTYIRRFQIVSNTGSVATISSNCYESTDGVTWSALNVNPSTITFPDNFIFGTHLKIVYMSNTSSTAGFILRGLFTVGLGATYLYPATSTVDITIPTWAQVLTPAYEDFMDEEIIKIPVPTNATYATMFGEQAVVSDGKDVYFSTESLGGSIQQFAVFNYFTPGTTAQGLIKGVFATEDFLITCRETETYYTTGNLSTGNYHTQPIGAVNVGLACQTSFVRFGNAGFFRANRGVYSIGQGAGFTELSDKIEPFFNDDYYNLGIVATKGTSCIDTKKERVYLSIHGSSAANDRVLTYDYKRDRWFPLKLGDEINSLVAICFFNGKLVYADTNKIYIESDSVHTFGGTQIDCFYRSAWQDLGEPSLQKKFLQVRAFSLDNTLTFSFGIKTYSDWDKNTAVTDATETFASGTRKVTRRLNTNRLLSMSIELTMTNTASKALITGVEYDYESVQEVMKG